MLRRKDKIRRSEMTIIICMFQLPLYTFWQSVARVNAKYAYIVHVVTGCGPGMYVGPV